MPLREYLTVPYQDKDDARRAGAKWDRAAKKWYAPAGAASHAFERWRSAATASSVVDAVEREFQSALTEAGLRLVDEAVMDGRLRRVPVEGDRPGQRSGAYVGFTDGHPAGYIQNFKTGVAESWKSARSKPLLSPEEHERLARDTKEKRLAREAARDARQLAAARTLERRFDDQSPSGQHPYLVAKGVAEVAARMADRGELRVDADGALLIPMRDIDGKLWSLQHVSADGTKGFARDGRIEATHALLLPADQRAMRPSDTLLIVEGYATGLTVSRATGLPVAVAFSGHNLLPVASAYRARLGEGLTLLIAGDNDHTKALEVAPNGLPKRNVGKELSEAAASAVRGAAILPIFNSSEGGTDWNDYERVHGLEQARSTIQVGIDRARLQLSGTTQSVNERVAPRTVDAARSPDSQRPSTRLRTGESSTFDNRDETRREPTQQRPRAARHRNR